MDFDFGFYCFSCYMEYVFVVFLGFWIYIVRFDGVCVYAFDFGLDCCAALIASLFSVLVSYVCLGLLFVAWLCVVLVG